jgi:large subunit ribosomal protein L9
MKLLLRKNVRKLGQIGDVVEVKSGYARNYLLPYNLATEPTEANLRAIEEEKQQYLEELAKQRKEIEARAKVLSGKEVTIAARANEEGHLYGSVGPAQIAAALAEEGAFIEPSEVQLGEPIRQLDKYDVQLVFDQDVTATVHVWVVPAREVLDDDADPDADDETPADETPADTESAGDSSDDE